MLGIRKIAARRQRERIKDRAGYRLTALVPARMYRRESGSKGPTNHKGRGNQVN